MSTEGEKPRPIEANSSASSTADCREATDGQSTPPSPNVSRPVTEGALRILAALEKKRSEKTLAKSPPESSSSASSIKDEARKLYQQLKANREKFLAQSTPSPANPATTTKVSRPVTEEALAFLKKIEQKRSQKPSTPCQG